jgi:radical SAM superfamily enzyme YgiQ (UPF0313 family)
MKNPFDRNRKPLWLPKEMRIAPGLPSRWGAVKANSILLVNPFYPKDPHASFGKHVLTPTLALTSVAAATPGHWSVRYWDENLLQGSIPAEPLPAVVGIMVHLTFARRAYLIADWFRNRGSIVILGGLHVLSCPEEAEQHADAIVIGEGVQLWPEVLRDIEAGALKKRYAATYERPYDLDPAPRRELLPRESFLTTASLIATRGCHNRCGFCYLSTDGLHMPYRVREAEDIRKQFEADDQPYAVFIDNNLGSKPEYLRRLCKALEPLEKIWSAAVTLDVTDDPSRFESLADENLSNAHKRTPRTEDYARRVRIFHENGIQVNGSFVLGFDGDDKTVFERTAEWIELNRLECATFHILTPYPGTPLFRQMELEGRLLHQDWSKYDTAHVVFRPARMTEEELALGYDWLYRRLFSMRSIWARRPYQASAVLPYLAMSLLYKKSNRLWAFLIKHRLVHTVWRPLVELTRVRHVRFRRKLRERADVGAGQFGAPVASGV